MPTRLGNTGVVLAALAALSCGASEGAPPFALEARLGVFQDGSGRAGLAVLATVRDDSGAGPAVPWSLSLHDASGASLADLSYAASGPGSYVARWFPSVAPGAGLHDLVAAGGGEEVRASVPLSDLAGLPLPVPVLAADASRIDWDPVPGARAYLCRVYAAGLLTFETSGTSPGCDLSALPPGAYGASILALSADLGAVAADTSAHPALGGAFHVSEARLGFARPDAGAPAVLLRAAGGAYDDGIGARSLAVWISITDPLGVATAVPWDVEVVGPNLPADAPLAITYWASFPRLMVWSPGVPASPGVYTVTARSAVGAAATAITVGTPPWLDQPFGVVARDGAQGAADASWDPVPGASAYLASAYDAVTGELSASVWSPGPSAAFPAGTFAAGRAYDVFVAASDADMVGGAVPTQVSISENVFDFASFTAR